MDLGVDAEALIKSMHGLGYYSDGNILVPALIDAAIKWLQLVQNTDGGFGEAKKTSQLLGTANRPHR